MPLTPTVMLTMGIPNTVHRYRNTTAMFFLTRIHLFDARVQVILHAM